MAFRGDDIPPQWHALPAAHRDYLVIACRECPERPYLSFRIPQGEPGTRINVRRVLLTFDSRDQGRADAEEHHNGTHSSSYSYVEARVIDPNGYDRVPREELTPNLRAYPHYQQYVVKFDYRDENVMIRHGDGSIRQWRNRVVPSDWLGSIRSGDEIRIIPQAVYQVWACYIERAWIEVWAETINIEATQREVFPNHAYMSYRALDVPAQEIRIVIIEPVRDDDKDRPPLLRIVTTKLSDPNRMRYEALSYCWGKGEETAVVLLVGDEESTPAKVQIPRNLQNALKRLQQRDIARHFWIDLLCINQNDVQERNNQVSIMGKIYSLANAVTVWLGELDEIRDTHRDLCTIKNIAQRYTHLVDDELDDGGSGYDAWKSKVQPYYETHSGEAINGDGRGSLSHFGRTFLRPWFKRVWVLQEVWNASSSLSKNDNSRCHDVRVLCGDLELQWWMLMQAHHCLTTIGFPYQVTGKSVTVRIFKMPEVWNKLFLAKGRTTNIPPQLVGTPGPRLDILSVVLRSLELDATDPRDRIFALLSFGQETHDSDALDELIKPNYEKSISQVYVDFSIWWIKQYKSLRILSAIHALKNRTWVDLAELETEGEEVARRPTWTIWHDREVNWHGTTLALDEDIDYEASGRREVDVDILTSDFEFPGKPDWTVPSFRGVRVGEISSREPFTVDNLVKCWGLFEAYVKIFDPVADRRICIDRPCDDYWNRIQRDMRLHLQIHRGSFGHFAHANETWLPCHGNCVFKTSDDHIGLCPAPVQTGDIVVILYGGRIPYLLRTTATDGVYAFVGECYLEGFMHGEALDSKRRNVHEEIYRLI